MNTNDFNRYLIYNEDTEKSYLSDKNLHSKPGCGTCNFGKLKKYIEVNLLWDGGINFDKNKIFSCFDPQSNSYDKNINSELINQLMEIILNQLLLASDNILDGDNLYHFVNEIQEKNASRIMADIVIKELQKY
jgi:hypothetical protein